MKVKYFRLNIVFGIECDCSFWALVYVPDGLPIGRLNVAGLKRTLCPVPLRTAAP